MGLRTNQEIHNNPEIVTFNRRFLIRLSHYYEQLKDESVTNISYKPQKPTNDSMTEDDEAVKAILTQEPNITAFRELVKLLDKE